MRTARPTHALAAGAAAAVIALLGVATIVLLPFIPARDAAVTFGPLATAAFTVMGVLFALTGALIVTRTEGTRLGIAMLVTGALTSFGLLTTTLGELLLDRDPTAPLVGWLGWLTTPATQCLPGLLALILLWFPDGRLPGRRWRAPAALAVASLVLLGLVPVIASGPLDPPFDHLPNPGGLDALDGLVVPADAIGWPLSLVGLIGGLASLRARRRQAGPASQTRLQLDVLLRLGAVCAGVVVLMMASWLIEPDGLRDLRMAVIGVAMAGFGAAIGVAVVRRRLYELDGAVARTVAYAALTVVVAAAYGLTAVTIGALAGRSSAWGVAVATLAAAAVAGPARRTLLRAVQRRFDPVRFGGLERIAAFQDALRAGEVEPEAIQGVLRDALGDPDAELLFHLPSLEGYVDGRGARIDVAAPAPGTATIAARGDAEVALLRHHRLGEAEQALAVAYVEAAALAIEVARLRAEVRQQLAEVAASRERIVAATHAERRRLERDLHDGAQQHLVSIGLDVRHVQHQLDRASSEVLHAELERVVAGLASAVGDLRALASGLPPSQLDDGLAAALLELAHRAPLPVEVHADPTRRYDQATEAAAYFVACEGLANAIKHAQASRVVLSVRPHGGQLEVRVADDGIGGAAPHPRGTGLRGLEDRVAAHGGSLRVLSERASGTSIVAELPCEC